jgi:hypothetical protein
LKRRSIWGEAVQAEPLQFRRLDMLPSSQMMKHDCINGSQKATFSSAIAPQCIPAAPQSEIRKSIWGSPGDDELKLGFLL